LTCIKRNLKKTASPLHMRRVAAPKIFLCVDAVDVWPRRFRRGGHPPPHLRFARPDEIYLVRGPVHGSLLVKRCVRHALCWEAGVALFLRLRSARGLPTTRACTVRTPFRFVSHALCWESQVRPRQAWAEGHPGRGTPRRRGTRSAGRGACD
jgi:hypothetical protein